MRDHNWIDLNGVAGHRIRPECIPGDRRENRRYRIELDLEYRVIRRGQVLETGVGRTIDISRWGICFRTEHLVLFGMDVELTIDWPVRLHNITPIQLLVTGRIVRCDAIRVGIHFTQYEFRMEAGCERVPFASFSRESRQPFQPVSTPESVRYQAATTINECGSLPFDY
jgi:hypothetical protein